MIKTILITTAITSAMLFGISNIAKADQPGMKEKIKPRDITNMTVKASVYHGKKFKSYEIIKAGDGEPVIGKKSFKFTLMPYDCGHTDRGTDCGEKVQGGNGGRARSEVTSSKYPFTGKNHERWLSFSIFIPEDYKTVTPTSASMFQIYKLDLGPTVMIRDMGGRLTVQLMDNQGFYGDGGTKNIKWGHLATIDEMKGKWTHFKIHYNITDQQDGFWKFYTNGELKVHQVGKTKGYVVPKGYYIKAGLYHTYVYAYKRMHGEDIPAQTIYMDNIFQAKTEAKLDKLISKAK